FALVGLRRTVATQFRGYLTDLLLVDAADDDFSRLRRRNRDALRDRIVDVMRKPELKIELLALHGGAETDAGDLQLLLKALGDAGNEIRHQRARRAPLRARALCLGARRDFNRAFVHLGRDVVVQHDLKSALRA